MTSAPSPRRNRHSIRLSGYDYAQPGIYFVTICVHNRCPLLQPLPVKAMIERWWAKLPEKFPTVELDAFIVMPNHVHGLLGIINEPAAQERVTLATIVQWFKTMTTNEYIRAVKGEGWARFDGQLWQRNYWDHIVRNEGDLARLRDYIENNPARWIQDSLHI